MSIKCLVWDLDNTVWEGVLLEDECVTLRPQVRPILEELDRRGILCSVASKTDFALASKRLQEFGIYDYFLTPQLNWNPKSDSLRKIAQTLNLDTNTFAFIDDQRFELEEVAHELPEVLCLPSDKLELILEHPGFQPRFITPESAQRRELYRVNLARERRQVEYTGNNEAFLATLKMVFEIKLAEESDLQRAEELTVRTSQLNSTGIAYSYEELDRFRTSKEHLLSVVRLSDRFGPYGTIGLCLVKLGTRAWTLQLLLVSCRAMSRGVGTVLMNWVMTRAREAGATLRAEFVPNERNRPMYITYKFAGFQEIGKRGEVVLLEHPLQQLPPTPSYIELRDNS